MKAFGVSLVLFEVLIGLLYGFFGKTTTSLINISSIVFTILLALLTTIGTTRSTQVSASTSPSLKELCGLAWA